MTDHELDDKIHEASTVLVLAPLTPDGNQAYMELVASTAANMNLAAITYTQPPAQWFEDWRRTIGALPREIRHIHASGMAHPGTDDDTTPASVTTEVVDPTDPMAIIVPLSRHLETWTDGDTQPVVSVQTLTVLLEYVDFDTTFRYLHILTHRIRAAGAIGFFQMEPDIHDPTTTKALKSLFDVIVERSDESGEWQTTPAVTPGTNTDTTDASTATNGDAATTPSTGQSDNDLLTTVRTTLAQLFDRSESDDEQTGSGTNETPATNSSDDDPEEGQTSIGNLADEEMLTDEERIRSLLIEYGGRMKQGDITAEVSWSKSTVSRKLATMEENGEITRVQVGRGNLVFLDGSEPAVTKSPFEA
ncbi:helix-turn-helix transcriptional regulator [Haladaptatus sp. NG-SE-30]